MANVNPGYTDPTAVDGFLQSNTGNGGTYFSPVIHVPVKDFLDVLGPGRNLSTVSIFVSAASPRPNSAGSVLVEQFNSTTKGIIALTTYPAIYKTFGGEDVKFQNPRVYPPILINNRQ